MMLPAKMSKAAVCWAVMGTARNPPAIQEHQKRIIALREPRRSFRRYHGATRYQSVFLLPLVTFGTWELGYDAVDFRNRNQCPQNASWWWTTKTRFAKSCLPCSPPLTTSADKPLQAWRRLRCLTPAKSLN